MLGYFNKGIEHMAAHDFQTFSEIANNLKTLRAKRGHILIPMGSISQRVYIITRGLIRQYRMNEHGEEINTVFAVEGEIVICFASFVTQTPSKEGVELLEDSEFEYFTYDELMDLLKSSHAAETAYRKIMELYYMHLKDDLFRMQTQTAMEKYHYLMEHYPHFLRRIPQLHLASYLGMATATLSRVRRDMQNK